MNRFGNLRDLTARQHQVTPTAAPQLNFLCGHKALRLGGQMRGYLPLRCAACAAARGGR